LAPIQGIEQALAHARQTVSLLEVTSQTPPPFSSLIRWDEGWNVLGLGWCGLRRGPIRILEALACLLCVRHSLSCPREVTLFSFLPMSRRRSWGNEWWIFSCKRRAAIAVNETAKSTCNYPHRSHQLQLTVLSLRQPPPSRHAPLQPVPV